MIAGLIESHLGASQYTVRVSYDTTAADALIVENEKVLADSIAQKAFEVSELEKIKALLTAALVFEYATQEKADEAQKTIDGYRLKIRSIGFVISMLSAEILRITKVNEFIEKTKGADKVLTIYSNLYDETLTGIVAVELIAGVIDAGVIITGGVQTELLSRAVNISKFHVYSNFALMPGWLKWAQVYSVATVTNAASPVVGDMAMLTNVLSLIGGILPFDKSTISSTTEYPYELGDQALVQFDSAGVQSFQGWYTEPRALTHPVMLLARSDQYWYYNTDGHTDKDTHKIFIYDSQDGAYLGHLFFADYWAKNDWFLSLPSYANWVQGATAIGTKTLTSLYVDYWNHSMTIDYTEGGVAYQRTHTIPDVCYRVFTSVGKEEWLLMDPETGLPTDTTIEYETLHKPGNLYNLDETWFGHYQTFNPASVFAQLGKSLVLRLYPQYAGTYCYPYPTCEGTQAETMDFAVILDANLNISNTCLASDTSFFNADENNWFSAELKDMPTLL